MHDIIGPEVFLGHSVFPNAFSARHVDLIQPFNLSYPLECDVFEPGATESRTSHTALIERVPENEWLYETASRLAVKANRKYKFALDGIDEPIQIIRYQVNGEVGWHIDCGDRGIPSRRKLSLTVQLSQDSDYAGGDLEFMCDARAPFARAFGSVVAFPSFSCHRVTPVLTGCRYAMVIFAHGSPFT